MPKNVKIIILRAAGTNCNEETAFAFSRFSASVSQVHINALVTGEEKLAEYHILALPGGFSYGDDIASGRILANELRLKLGEDIKQFIRDGKLIIGICNGFQVLVKAGILPGLGKDWQAGAEAVWRRQEATLFNNDSAKFEARWTYLRVEKSHCIWTQGLRSLGFAQDDSCGIIYLPVAHGEGKFIPRDEGVLQALKANGQIVFRYCSPDGRASSYPGNPNGSVEGIAGICDTTGRVLGLMPHPERHFFFEQHPFWTRLPKRGEFGDGAKIFENGVNYIKEHL